MADITVQWAGRSLRFPDLNMLANFANHARRPLLEMNDQALRVVDVGACVGGWTVAQAITLPNAHFTCFEPNPAAVKYLRHNTLGLKVDLNQTAVSDVAGTLTFYLDAENMGKDSAFGKGEHFSAETVRLDDVEMGMVNILKIDVEGMELAVLRGAERVLAESRPWVIVEILQGQADRAGHTPEDIYRWLKRHGYGEPQKVSSSDWLFRQPERN